MYGVSGESCYHSSGYCSWLNFCEHLLASLGRSKLLGQHPVAAIVAQIGGNSGFDVPTNHGKCLIVACDLLVYAGIKVAKGKEGPVFDAH